MSGSDAADASDDRETADASGLKSGRSCGRFDCRDVRLQPIVCVVCSAKLDDPRGIAWHIVTAKPAFSKQNRATSMQSLDAYTANKMTDSARDDYLDPYRQASRAHGAGFKATLWNSEEGQRMRFEVMIDMARLDNAVILDAGCGPGDFLPVLLERGVEYRRFIGIDGIDEQIARARDHRYPRADFKTGDFVREPSLLRIGDPDYICFSGTLNTMDQDVAKQLVEDAFNVAQRGVVFNFLSDHPAERYRAIELWPARRFDTLHMVAFALGLSPRVRFRQDYLDGHDATILIEHELAEE